LLWRCGFPILSHGLLTLTDLSTPQEQFEDEIHPRLRFSHRGLVACANNGTKNSNDSQFFITLGALISLYLARITYVLSQTGQTNSTANIHYSDDVLAIRFTVSTLQSYPEIFTFFIHIVFRCSQNRYYG
jgi:cyclophilin family peptidyl-prolyl cis-trans isomerase